MDRKGREAVVSRKAELEAEAWASDQTPNVVLKLSVARDQFVRPSREQDTGRATGNLPRKFDHTPTLVRALLNEDGRLAPRSSLSSEALRVRVAGSTDWP